MHLSFLRDLFFIIFLQKTSFPLIWSKHEVIIKAIPYSDQLGCLKKGVLQTLRKADKQYCYLQTQTLLFQSCSKSNLIFNDQIMLWKTKLPLRGDFSLSCIEEENGNLLQCSCLENPRDGGVWWAAPSMGSHRVGHDWSDLAAAAAAVISGWVGLYYLILRGE